MRVQAGELGSLNSPTGSDGAEASVGGTQDSMPETLVTLQEKEPEAPGSSLCKQAFPGLLTDHKGETAHAQDNCLTRR